MSEYVKNIQTIEDMWKKRIELHGERKWLTCKCGHEMESEGKCPMCGRWVHE